MVRAVGDRHSMNGASRSARATGQPSASATLLADHWLTVFIVLSLIWVGLPWLAPVFMNLGWQIPAEAIYFIYSFQCHQLPQQSFYVFGPQAMYSLGQINAVSCAGTDPWLLRQFVGTAELGYEVAWSDRMVYAYGSLPLAAIVWRWLSRWLRPLP